MAPAGGSWIRFTAWKADERIVRLRIAEPLRRNAHGFTQFLSYPRHEYFRRILCNILGREVEDGLLPASELPFIGKMVEDISYNNAKGYFKF